MNVYILKTLGLRVVGCYVAATPLPDDVVKRAMMLGYRFERLELTGWPDTDSWDTVLNDAVMSDIDKDLPGPIDYPDSVER